MSPLSDIRKKPAITIPEGGARDVRRAHSNKGCRLFERPRGTTRRARAPALNHHWRRTTTLELDVYLLA